MKRTLIAAAVSAALMLSGCAGDKQRPDADTTTDASSETSTDAASGDGSSSGNASSSDVVERWISGECPDAATVSGITGSDLPEPQEAPDFTEAAAGCLYGDADTLETMEQETTDTVLFVGAYDNAEFMDPAQYLEDRLLFQEESVTMLDQYPEGSFTVDMSQVEDGADGCVAVIIEEGTDRHALGIALNLAGSCPALIEVMETP